MSKVIMIGCDLHDRSMLLRYSVGEGARPYRRPFSTICLGAPE